MKAVRIHAYGGADVLRVETAERPTPATGDLLVRVVAAGVNPVDHKLREGHLAAYVPLKLPWIPGADFSGVVEEVGASVSTHKKGDAVYGKADVPADGSYAEYVVVPAAHVAAKPHTLDHVRAAAVPLAAMTAWQALFGGTGKPSLELAPGQTLLVLGASGGVGSFAVQLAVARGAKVIGVVRAGARESEQDAFVRSLGASDVVDVESMTLHEKVDAILDLIGGPVQERAWAALKPGGAFASTMGAPSADLAQQHGARAISIWTETSGSQLDELGALIDAGEIQVQVADVLGLDDARRAHEMLANGSVKGKLVLRVE
ncbi:MAG TPA: NADP-dependent oxidoreductase [Kofleriaceae bacterium]|nr:NADP-dependent oxidoreductase [Kofleriaceae bacterium]